MHRTYLSTILAGTGILLVVLSGLQIAAAAGKRPLPRFVSLRFETINVRAGPGRQYPIRWVYKRKGLPVEITREVYNWRLVRDVRGDRGWIHVSNLTSRRSALVRRKRQALRTKPARNAKAVAILSANVVVQLRTCGKDWCSVRINRFRGWLPRTALWGLYPKERIE